MRLASIDVALVHQFEVHIELVAKVSFYLLVLHDFELFGALELPTRECNNLETLLRILVVEVAQLPTELQSERSVRAHVRDDHHLLALD